MPDIVDLLAASVTHLAEVVARLTPDVLNGPSPNTTWTVAQTLSHLGSGAVIMGHRLDQALGGPERDPQPVWDEWDAKDPAAQAAAVAPADAAGLAQFRATTAEQREGLQIALGPMTLDFPSFVRMRLAEHVLHTWDVEMVLDPTATLADDAAVEISAMAPMIAQFSGRPVGDDGTVVVGPGGPGTIAVTMRDGQVQAAPSEADPDVVLPAEAVVRLVFGRLAADHTPAVEGDASALDRLRAMFPGI